MKRMLALIFALALTMMGCEMAYVEHDDPVLGLPEGDAYPYWEETVPTDPQYDWYEESYWSESPETSAPEQWSGTTGTRIEEDGWYYSAEEVSLYIYTYGCLPDNYITKSQARDLGWEGGSVEYYAPGCAIGGDRFYNYEGQLPGDRDTWYYECDIDTDGRRSRGAKRLVFTQDGDIYYTTDHYETFVCLYGEALP